MATSSQESGLRNTSYPAVPEETWWRLRKLFNTKGQPKPWNEDYVESQGIRASKASAANLVRPFKRIGLFTDDGKPTQRYWNWIDDAKYKEVCQEILHEVYPETLTNIFTSVDTDERERLDKWFQRNVGVKPSASRHLTAFYMLLLEGDASKQDGAAAPRTAKTPSANRGQRAGSGSPSSRHKSEASAAVKQSEAQAGVVDGVPITHQSEHHTTATKRTVHGVEPSLNINVQIHIPAEASPDQIDQIFRSMAKHLYQRRDEASE